MCQPLLPPGDCHTITRGYLGTCLQLPSKVNVQFFLFIGDHWNWLSWTWIKKIWWDWTPDMYNRLPSINMTKQHTYIVPRHQSKLIYLGTVILICQVWTHHFSLSLIHSTWDEGMQLLGEESSKQLGGVSEVCQNRGKLLAHKFGAVSRAKRELINHWRSWHENRNQSLPYPQILGYVSSLSLIQCWAKITQF